MKCIICVQAKHAKKSFPSKAELTGFRHDLNCLLKRILSVCYTPAALTHPETRADYDFLTADPSLHPFCDILSEFGRGDRYYNLDVVCGERVSGRNSNSKWLSEQMSTTFRATGDVAASNPADFMRACRSCVTILLERLTRALCRTFVLGPGVELGKGVEVLLQEFLSLSDSQLGKRDYPHRRPWPGPP